MIGNELIYSIAGIALAILANRFGWLPFGPPKPQLPNSSQDPDFRTLVREVLFDVLRNIAKPAAPKVSIDDSIREQLQLLAKEQREG